MASAESEFVLGPDHAAREHPVYKLKRVARRLIDDARTLYAERAPSRSPFFVVAPADRTRLRALLIALVTMPLVFVIVVTASLAFFGRPAAEAPRRDAAVETLKQPATVVVARSALSATPAASFSGRPIVLPANASAGALALDGDRLAMRVDAPEGSIIVIYDLTQGAVTQTVVVSQAE